MSNNISGLSDKNGDLVQGSKNVPSGSLGQLDFFAAVGN